MRIALLIGALALAGCVSQRDAVNLGLATACDSSTSVERLGDRDSRFAVARTSEVCEGNPNDASTDRTVTLIDCTANLEMATVVFRNSRLPARRGANVDFTAEMEQQVALLRVGLADLPTVRQRLNALGAQTTQGPGTAAARCAELASSGRIL